MAAGLAVMSAVRSAVCDGRAKILRLERGDWLECIDGSPCPHTGDSLTAGRLYRVREVVRLTGEKKPALRLVGATRTSHSLGYERTWEANRFRWAAPSRPGPVAQLLERTAET